MEYELFINIQAKKNEIFPIELYISIRRIFVCRTAPTIPTIYVIAKDKTINIQ